MTWAETMTEKHPKEINLTALRWDGHGINDQDGGRVANVRPCFRPCTDSGNMGGDDWADFDALGVALATAPANLEAEREKVRLLRDALENLVDRDLIKGDPYLDDYFEEVGDALAATVDPENPKDQ